MTNLSMPEAVLIIGILLVLRRKPLINYNAGWQWFDTKEVNNGERK